MMLVHAARIARESSEEPFCHFFRESKGRLHIRLIVVIANKVEACPRIDGQSGRAEQVFDITPVDDWCLPSLECVNRGVFGVPGYL